MRGRLPRLVLPPVILHFLPSVIEGRVGQVLLLLLLRALASPLSVDDSAEDGWTEAGRSA